MVVVHDRSKAEKRAMNQPTFDVAHEEQVWVEVDDSLENQTLT